jgi:hypothetical protein
VTSGRYVELHTATAPVIQGRLSRGDISSTRAIDLQIDQRSICGGFRTVGSVRLLGRHILSQRLLLGGSKCDIDLAYLWRGSRLGLARLLRGITCLLCIVILCVGS